MVVLGMSCLLSLYSVTSSNDGDMDSDPQMPRVAINLPKYNS